jgi:hypothetical protein
MDIVESSRLLDNSKVCMQRQEGAVDGQRTSKTQEIFKRE